MLMRQDSFDCLLCEVRELNYLDLREKEKEPHFLKEKKITTVCQSLLERIKRYEGLVLSSPGFANGMLHFVPCYLEPLWVWKEKQLNSVC